MSGPGTYWSVEECGWVACPGRPDALATPWSAHGVQLRPVPTPKDGEDLLRSRRSGALPAQRDDRVREPERR